MSVAAAFGWALLVVVLFGLFGTLAFLAAAVEQHARAILGVDEPVHDQDDTATEAAPSAGSFEEIARTFEAQPFGEEWPRGQEL